ncbi:YodL domain-containing protein [Metabacillus malikii]|uniref:YodL-like domain-containing protein n=1 Tax=Metabacillus malikii TaxID=1504265 RepID=A0ABT9Z9H7_9BACI|nr:YodL domain-containing protein [Metabacillus malikii]MDQ0228897.1 hypothetical protein [Metabacillus malikii]
MVKTLLKKRLLNFDITIFQTPKFGEKKGYQAVYRLIAKGESHRDVMEKVFQTFNVSDLIPNDYDARYLGTGDIVFIDEGKKGQYYYQLKPEGWKRINRIIVR